MNRAAWVLAMLLPGLQGGALPATGHPEAGDDAGVRGEVPVRSVRAEEAPARTDSVLTLTRLRYEGGGDWYTGPSMLPNLLAAIREWTGIPTAEREATVSASDPTLSSHPFLFMTGHGNVRFSGEERSRLRAHLLSGGFLHADDNYGMDESFRREMKLLFPDRPLVPIPPDHPIFGTPFSFPEGLPKIHEHDNGSPTAWGIFQAGRLMVLYTHESDLGNGWEDAGVHGDPPDLRLAALRMGVNIVLHALSQGVP